MNSKNDSFVLNFYLKNSPISGKIVVLHSVLDEAYKGRNYSVSTCNLLAKNMALTCFTGNSIKAPAIITSQIQSSSDVPKYLVSELYSNYKLRTFVRLDSGEDFNFDNSFLTLTVDWEEESYSRYQSVIKLESDDLDSIFEDYFQQSQQTPAKIKSYFNYQGDLGSSLTMIMIEKNPYNKQDYFDDPWEKAKIFFSTISQKELAQMSGNYSRLLDNIFAEDEVLLGNFTQLRWECKCSESRLKSILKQMSDDGRNNPKKHKGLEIKCHYCGKEYLIKTQGCDSGVNNTKNG